MASVPVSEEQVKEAHALYDISFKCGLTTEEGLKYALTALHLDERLYLKKIIEQCVRRDNEGKDGQIELFNFREAIIAIDEENRQCGQDLKEIWQELLGGVGRK